MTNDASQTVVACATRYALCCLVLTLIDRYPIEMRAKGFPPEMRHVL